VPPRPGAGHRAQFLSIANIARDKSVLIFNVGSTDDVYAKKSAG
jgi:hypothetical protein